MAKRTYNDLSIIVAVDATGGYAKDNSIPWSFKEDWKHFQAVTKNTVCLMGRGTYEDIAERRAAKSSQNAVTAQPDVLLPNRSSYVVSRTLTGAKGATAVSSIQVALDSLPNDQREVFVLGGRNLWVEIIPYAKQVWMTIVPGTYDTNKKFPIDELSKLYTIVEGREENGLKFVRYVRKVNYYTIERNRIPQAILVDHFKMTNRFVKTDDQGGIVIVRPTEEELHYFRPKKREGLAIE